MHHCELYFPGEACACYEDGSHQLDKMEPFVGSFFTEALCGRRRRQDWWSSKYATAGDALEKEHQIKKMVKGGDGKEAERLSLEDWEVKERRSIPTVAEWHIQGWL